MYGNGHACIHLCGSDCSIVLHENFMCVCVCVCVCDAVRGQGGVRDEPQGLELPSGH